MNHKCIAIHSIEYTELGMQVNYSSENFQTIDNNPFIFPYYIARPVFNHFCFNHVWTIVL